MLCRQMQICAAYRVATYLQKRIQKPCPHGLVAFLRKPQNSTLTSTRIQTFSCFDYTQENRVAYDASSYFILLLQKMHV
jgi:hypothetical protein